MNSVAVIIEDRDSRVLLLLRGPTAPWMPLHWNLPGGMVEHGESPTEAAVREVREETGLHVQPVRLVPVVRARAARGGSLDVFYATHWSGNVQLIDQEHESYAWVPRVTAAGWDLVPPQRDVLRWLAAQR